MANVLIIGGSRFMGPLLVDKLAARGHRVTVFNRGRISATYPAGVRFVRGDRREGFRFAERFDVVVDMCAYAGADTERALRELEFDFFIHMSTAAVYRKPDTFPLTEASPLGDWPLWGEYNAGKVACERVLAEIGKPYATVRPVYVLGAGSHLDRERFIYAKVRRGEPLVLPGNGQAMVQFVFSDEVAETLAILAEGRIPGVFNCGGDGYVTLSGFVQMAAEIAGREPVIRFNALADGENFDIREFPFANEHFITSNERAKALGVRFSPLREGLARDYERYYRAATEISSPASLPSRRASG